MTHMYEISGRVSPEHDSTSADKLRQHQQWIQPDLLCWLASTEDLTFTHTIEFLAIVLINSGMLQHNQASTIHSPEETQKNSFT